MQSSLRSLTRNPDLKVAAVYEREIRACLSGVWENVYDWEHLPWLHDQAFTSIRLIESGDWGWSAQIGVPQRGESVIELVTDREAGCYVARTIEGNGAPTEIWTSLRSAGRADDPAASTTIRVEFCIPPAPEQKLKSLGESYLEVYATLLGWALIQAH